MNFAGRSRELEAEIGRCREQLANQEKEFNNKIKSVQVIRSFFLAHTFSTHIFSTHIFSTHIFSTRIFSTFFLFVASIVCFEEFFSIVASIFCFEKHPPIHRNNGFALSRKKNLEPSRTRSGKPKLQIKQVGHYCGAQLCVCDPYS